MGGDPQEASTFSTKSCIATISALLLAGCGGESAAPLTLSGPVTFMAENDLIAPVTISASGSPYAILSPGQAMQMTLPANTRLTWTSAKPADAQGNRIADEIGEQQVNVPAVGTLEITNVIGLQTYFTARIFNLTTTRVSIGVFDGRKVWCAADLPAATATRPGFTLIGYYRLLPETELRAYTTLADCTGTYVPWPSSQLTGYEAKSGLLTLSLESTR